MPGTLSASLSQTQESSAKSLNVPSIGQASGADFSPAGRLPPQGPAHHTQPGGCAPQAPLFCEQLHPGAAAGG